MLERQLKSAIEISELSLNAISKASGVDYSVLHRFVNEGRNLQLDVVQRLCDYFGLELNVSKQRIVLALKKSAKSLLTDYPRDFRKKGGVINRVALTRHMMAPRGVAADDAAQDEREAARCFELLADVERRRMIKEALNEVEAWEKVNRSFQRAASKRLSELDREIQEFKAMYSDEQPTERRRVRNCLKRAATLGKDLERFGGRYRMRLRIEVSHCDMNEDGEEVDAGRELLKPDVMLQAVKASESEEEFTPKANLGLFG